MEKTRNEVVNELKECINRLDKICDDVMEIECEELKAPLEKLVNNANTLASYNLFCSIMDLKNVVVKLAGDE